MRRSTLVTIIVVIALIALGAIFFASKKSGTTSPSPSPSQSPSPTANASASPLSSASPAAESKTIDYNGSGFSPNTITVAKGTKLTIKNATSNTIQVDSNPHPEHTDNTEFNIGTIAPGGSGTTVELTRTGTWKIHNHLDPTMQATVVVQ